MDRQNSARLYTTSLECLDAAKVLYAAGYPWTEPVPTMVFLLGQSIELSLKAFLHGSGLTREDLKNPKIFGHHLERCFIAARDKGLDRLVVLDEADEILIKLVSAPYHGKDLQYVSVGVKNRPNVVPLMALATKLCEGIERFAIENRKRHNLDFPKGIK